MTASRQAAAPLQAYPLEFSFMLACLQAHLERAASPDWSQYPLTELDFTRLLAMCRHHEVTPLVLQTLQTLDLDAENLDTAVLEPFRQDVAAETRWAFQLTRQLLELLARFRQAEVPVLSHKGIVLSQLLFGDVAARPTKDLDIVVPAAQYQRAKACLHDLGYEGPFADTGDVLDETWERFYLARMHHVEFYHPQRDGAVELHWRLSPDFRGEQFEANLWSSLVEQTFFGTPVAVLNQPLLFCILSEHGAAHHWFRLKWLFDTAVLLDRDDLRAEAWALDEPHPKNQVATSYLLCKDLFGLALPSTLKVSAAQTWLAQQVTQQFRTFPIGRVTGLSRYRYQLLLLNSRNPRLVWKVLRHYLYENDRFRWHTSGRGAYGASARRLAQRALGLGGLGSKP